MSRSFPCPSSGYARNWANGQNLVESTKIERAVVDPKRALRGQKEKKEKRKEKKQRREKSKKALEQYTTKLGNKLEQHYLPSKETQDESEQLEKSGLTEEHEQPQNLCYLSDGSQGNKKRKREDPPAVESHVKAVPGKPLRIRFVFRKPKEPEAVPQEERVCSTSGAQCLAQNEKVVQDTQARCVISAKTSDEEENLPSTSLGVESAAIPIDTRKKKHKKSKESRYNALFEDWVPPVLSAVLDVDDDDQDWLFGSRRQEKPTAKAVEMDKDVSMNLPSLGSSPSWPRAQYLPEVGIHSLPYTIPF